MTQRSTQVPLSGARRRAILKGHYFEMPRAETLDAALAAAVEDFDAGNLTGEHFEGTGLVVVGESGTGKTREINQALKRFASDPAPLECGLQRRFLQLALVGETTWKALGIELLKELGFPITARRTEHEIWSRVRTQLKGQGVWLIHIDECQHMFETLGANETRKVLNSIKTAMKHRDWPMVMILSGIPELLDKVNSDPQFHNLMTPIHLDRFDPNGDDLNEIDSAFVGLAEAVNADIGEVRNEDVYLRMSYACLDLYGRVFRFMVDVFASLPNGQNKVTRDFLAARYAFHTGCMPAHNVFIRDDYEACTAGKLMAGK
ncbi:TniB family NTP-binding protein (plasmid) [Cereibacter azotoformans]|uniref:TniB family NTP-binding protein n=1 Tax=Cereibacter azotoformans TaxID=43057 RepID=UPI003B20F257